MDVTTHVDVKEDDQLMVMVASDNPNTRSKYHDRRCRFVVSDNSQTIPESDAVNGGAEPCRMCVDLHRSLKTLEYACRDAVKALHEKKSTCIYGVAYHA
jgi:hypothetical protein